VTAPPLVWKPEQDVDIHLLRGGPESRRLMDGLDLASGQAFSVTFIPKFTADIADTGLEISPDGIVKAHPHPNPSFPKLRNFLLEALFDDGGGATLTERRSGSMSTTQ
jgi:hypothetical protein